MAEHLANSPPSNTVRPRRAQSDDITTKISRYKDPTESTVFNGDVRGYVGMVMKAEFVIAHAQINLSPNNGSNHHPPMASGISTHETDPSPQIAHQRLAPLMTDGLKADNGLSDSPVTPDQELEREAEGKRLLDTGLCLIKEGSRLAKEGNRLVEKGTRRFERAQRLLQSAPEQAGDRNRRS